MVTTSVLPGLRGFTVWSFLCKLFRPTTSSPVLLPHPACNLLSAWLLCNLGLGTLGSLYMPSTKAYKAKGHRGASVGGNQR